MAGTWREGKGLESQGTSAWGVGSGTQEPWGPRPCWGPGHGAGGQHGLRGVKSLCRVALWVLGSLCTWRGGTMVPLGGTQPRLCGDPHAWRRTMSSSLGLPPGWPHCPVIQGCSQGSSAMGQQPGRGRRGIHEASFGIRGASGARELQSPRLRGPCGATEPVPLPGMALTASHDLTRFIPKY